MKSISELHTLIEKELKEIKIPNSPENLYNPIEYVLSIGGKRMRPILLLLSHQLFSDDIKLSVNSALAIEVFHNFTLLHDDIMDNAPLRRGFKTVHEKWNNNTAILSGDTMLVQSYNLLMDVEDNNLRTVFETFNKSAKEVCEGQQWDMDFEGRDDVSLSEYMKMIEYKTAVLLASSLKIGAINGGATSKDAEHLYQFGLNLGIAFQLKDDLLDSFGDPEKFGKQIGGDILSNKKTFLYLKSLQIADEKTKDKLLNHFSNDEENKVEKVKAIFSQLDVPKHTTEMIKSYYTKSIKHLDSVNSDKKQELISFAEQLKERIS